MLEPIVVLAGPKNEGNIGAVARVMKNFSMGRLVLVKPCPIADEAYKRAMQGADVLANARVVDTLDEALAHADFVAGTTGIVSTNEKRFLRLALTPKEFARRTAAMDGALAILFGREDFGLYEEELARCDLLVSIPASERYPVLNVSHAVAIVLYELFASKGSNQPRKASRSEKELLYAAFADLLEATTYPPHKRGRTSIMFRRMIGRAVPSKWEFHALMGVFTRAAKTIRRRTR